MRVLVVWEPVIATDVAPPTTKTLARIHDSRAVQYWDHDRAVSTDIVRAVLASLDRYALDEEVHPDSIVWDSVAVFPPDARWLADLPIPTYFGYPVADAARDLEKALTATPAPAPERAPGSDPSTL